MTLSVSDYTCELARPIKVMKRNETSGEKHKAQDSNEAASAKQVKGSSQHQVGGEWFEIELGKISRMLVKYEVLPIPNVISVC